MAAARPWDEQIQNWGKNAEKRDVPQISIGHADFTFAPPRLRVRRLPGNNLDPTRKLALSRGSVLDQSVHQSSTIDIRDVRFEPNRGFPTRFVKVSAKVSG